MESTAYRRATGYFSARLREAMGGHSIRGFAEACGLSPSVIRNYLNDESLPTLDRLEAIAQAAGKPMGWFVDAAEGVRDTPGTYAPGPPQPVDTNLLTDIIAVLERIAAEAGLALTPEKKATLITLVYQYHADRHEAADAATVRRFVDIAK